MISAYIFGYYWIATKAGIVAVPETPLQAAPASLMVACAIPCAMALLLQWFVVPLPAGRQVTAATARGRLQAPLRLTAAAAAAAAAPDPVPTP